jgi:GNAT superfamily N-acetyltransferase
MTGGESLPLFPWSAERLDQLTALVAECAAFEDLTGDEILTACWERPGTVIGDEAGTVAVAVGIGRDSGGELVAVVRLLAVHPDLQRKGHGSRLLEQAETWARDRGATRIELGGALPFPLWPGVDSESGLVPLAAARGFVSGSAGQSLVVPVAFRGDPPPGVVVRRVVTDDDVMSVTLAVAKAWPRISDEVARALDHGTCHAAFEFIADPDGIPAETVVGIGCHSVTRATWMGPFVVHPGHRRRGIGHALLGQVCRDLMIAEFPFVEAPGVSDAGVEEFLIAAGAKRSRVFTRHVKTL